MGSNPIGVIEEFRTFPPDSATLCTTSPSVRRGLFAFRPISMQRGRCGVLATPLAGITIDALTSGSDAKWQNSTPSQK